jgi:hypothetical protein
MSLPKLGTRRGPWLLSIMAAAETTSILHMSNAAVVVPWHIASVKDEFFAAWGITAPPDWLVMEHDSNKEGCAVTKNRGVRRAVAQGAEVVVVLDSDCFPDSALESPKTLEELIACHLAALEPQNYPVFKVTTKPAARGVPYFNRMIQLPVAASVGWWSGMPDRDAARQLIEGVTAEMEYYRGIVYGRPTMLCGMNIAFRPREWAPWCDFLNVSRMDDVFMSWLWCKEAARRNHCFNLNGPTIRHSRQSKVFASLIDEAKWLEFNEHIWADIWMSSATDYETLRGMIPVARETVSP